MQSYKSVRQGNLVDLVFDKLKQDIVDNKLKSGDKFPPQDILAGQFGVSRTVIREAQKKLASLGLVKNRQGSGTYVCRPKAEEVMGPMLSLVELDAENTADLMETRYHLEKAIARLAAERATADAGSRLRGYVEKMAQSSRSGQLEDFNQADMAFHLELAKISGNRVMAKVVQAIQGMTHRFLQSFSRSEGAMERAIKFHKAIARAVAANDPGLAEKLMREHLEDIIDNVNRHFELELKIKPGKDDKEQAKERRQ
jgi:GntR family transcriptional repressor for pyruvate dehydrogenase complex